MSPKKKEITEKVEQAPNEVVKAPKGLSNATVTRKVGRDEVISLQIEGKLVGFDPATGMGVVREEGHPCNWPGGACEADRSLSN